MAGSAARFVQLPAVFGQTVPFGWGGVAASSKFVKLNPPPAAARAGPPVGKIRAAPVSNADSANLTVRFCIELLIQTSISQLATDHCSLLLRRRSSHHQDECNRSHRHYRNAHAQHATPLPERWPARPAG